MDQQPDFQNFQPQPQLIQPQPQPDFYIQDQIDYMQQLQNDYDYDNQTLPRRTSSQDQSSSHRPQHQSQHQIKQLIETIYRQCAKIDELTHLGLDGSFVLYWKTGWRMGLCEEYIARGRDYLREVMGWKGDGMGEEGKQGEVGGQELECAVCNQAGCSKVRNICGHAFCKQCWADYLSTSLDCNPNIPFPPCMQQGCPIAMSITICRLLCSSSSTLTPSSSSSNSIFSTTNNQSSGSLSQKFVGVLCRCYATENTSVKVCKGRQGTTCTQCFRIEPSKMLGVIVCESCDNYVCPRCGQLYHGTSNCKLIQKWHKIFLTTMGLIQYFSYQSCPNCKNGVQRIAGCNEIVCRCKTTFCYICGEIWEPQHPNNTNGADYCPNYKKVAKIYRERKIREKSKVNKFCFRIEAVKEATNTIESMILKIERLKQQLPVIIKKFLQCFKFHESQLKILQYYCNFMKKTLCILSGEAISTYFIENSRSDFFTKRLHEELSKIYTFTFEFVQEMYAFLMGQIDFEGNIYQNKHVEDKDKDKEKVNQNKEKDKNDNKNNVVRKKKIYRKQKQIQNLIRNKENFQEFFFEKIKELEASKISIIKIAKEEFQSDVF